ncbi:hypothetical protein ACUWCL_28935, partial [Klebsiella pneumoniae]|uniref:hypothetical protein n=1 Tax=Klebsiella pneumoniae TaxID=573 RepID=UPI0040558CDF
LSTFHHDAAIDPDTSKPQVIINYNHNLVTVPVLRTREEVDRHLTFITDVIVDAADTSIPKFSPMPLTLQPPPDHILKIIALRNNWKNRWYRTRDRQAKVVVN